MLSDAHRLPALRDRANMPYLNCILKEILRWGTVSPVGLFHCNSADDNYAGFDIPAKTTLIPNIWAMMHDEAVYPDPSRFDPSRFIEASSPPPQRDPRGLAFGFGRRICPGQHVAESSIFIQMAMVLATLDIRKAVDGMGQLIEPEIAFTTGLVRYG